jgi:polysaccharide biosynthesis transport protein
MHPLLFLSALRARFGLFSLALGLTLATATVVSLLMPESFRATASLVVDTRQEQSISNSLDTLGSPRERNAYLQTQVDIIRSPKVARRVVDDLQLAERPSVREDYARGAGETRGPIEDWLASRLRENLQVRTTQSSVIELSYIDADPEDAALIANAYAAAYIATMLELRVEPTRQAASWFDEQLTTLRAQLEQAQARMTEFQRTHGIVSADERTDERFSRFAELSAQLLRAQEQAIEHQVQVASARRLIETNTPLTQLPEIQSNPYIQRLDAELLEGQSRLEVIATAYGVNHPDYRSQLAENARKREDLEAEARKLIAASENGALQNQQRVTELENALNAQRTQLLEVQGSRDSLTVLMRDVDSAKNAYDVAMQRYIVSQVESRASHTNIAMLSAASAPRGPRQPNLLLNLALALVAGTVIGGGLVMLAEVSDRRVRSILDLTEGSDTPLLGEIDGTQPSRYPLLPSPGDGSGQGKQLRLTTG